MTLSSKGFAHVKMAGRACAVVLAGALLLSGCGAAGAAGDGQAEGAATQEAAQEQESAPEQEPLTAEEMDSWLAGEGDFVGRPVKLVAQVFNVRREDGATMLQVHADLDHSTDNIVVLYEGTDLKVGSQSYVTVSGTIADEDEYENVFGTMMTAPCIHADSVEELSYKDAVAPTTSSLKPEAVNEQNGYKVTVDTIEFSDKETRVYLTVTNGGAGRFNLSTSTAAVVQDGVQYNGTTNVWADYPTFSNFIVPGASMSGVITFPPLEVAGFELWLQGSSDNYEVDKGSLDFNFKFNVK